MTAADRANALARASHPAPTVAVTTFAVLVAALPAGQPPRTVLLVGVAVLAGQLSIGWSNDAHDVAADRAAARPDKPTVTGAVSGRTLWAASAVAALACVPASLALGTVAGLLHLLGVACGWAYNLGLKRTPASPAPYALAFALLALAVFHAAPVADWPGADVVVAAALLGTGAHFANAAADIPDDLAAGVRGLPQRLGARRSLLVTAGLVGVAAVVLAVGPSRPGPVGTGLLVAGALGAVLAGRVRTARAFPVTLVAVGLVVTGLLVGG